MTDSSDIYDSSHSSPLDDQYDILGSTTQKRSSISSDSQTSPNSDAQQQFSEEWDGDGVSYWEFLDDKGVLQGPYSSKQITIWVSKGHFDNKGRTLFRRKSSFSVYPFRPLYTLIHSIITPTLYSAVKRVGPERPLQKKQLEVDPAPIVLSYTNSEDPKLSQQIFLDGTSADMDLVIKYINDRPHRQVLLGEVIDDTFSEPEDQTEWWDINLYLGKGKLINFTNGRANAAIDSSEIAMRVHRVILKNSCDFFRTDINNLESMFSLGIALDQTARLSYEISTCFPKAVYVIIRSLYGFPLDKCDVLTLVAVLMESKRFGLDSIACKCIQEMSRGWDSQFLIAAAIAAEALEMDVLLHDCISALAHLGFLIFSDGTYEHLGPKAFKLLLDSDFLQVDELELFICASLWLHLHPSSRLTLTSDLLKYYDSFKHPPPIDDKIIWDGPRCRKEEAALAQCIYSSIRFCTMSRADIKAFRKRILESLMLDAMFRKSFHEELPIRCVPWKENSEFRIEFFDGLFPLRISRVFSPNNPEYFNAWTCGTFRPSSDILWAVEVSRCDSAYLNIGVAVSTRGSNEGCTKRTVFFYNSLEGTFHSAVISTDYKRVSYRVTCGTAKRKDWGIKIKKGDVIVIRATVGLGSIHMIVYLMYEPQFKAQNIFPHKIPTIMLGEEYKRHGLLLAPFLECSHVSDVFCIPSLQGSENTYIRKTETESNKKSVDDNEQTSLIKT